jgi:tRNA threonylcarbamoyladenosine biosynthesis protein TsaB
MTRLLLIETSARTALSAVAEGTRVVAERRLDDSRRNARDLAPGIRELLQQLRWKPGDLTAIAVGLGPGSYTGLRVGLMTAKALAFATGCALLGIETFAILAHQVPAECQRVDVIADAQKDSVYLQSFVRDEGRLIAASALEVRPVADWLTARHPEAWAAGPGLSKYAARLDGVPTTPPDSWLPGAEAMLALALARLGAGEKDDVMSLGPLYARPSSAEQQWASLGR